MGAIGGGGEVRGVEILAGAERKAYAQIAVAKAEDLVLTVDIRYLVDIAVLLGALADMERFFLGDVASLAGLYQIVGIVAETNAAVILDFTGALAGDAPCVAAGAVADGELAVLLVEPV